MMIRRAILFGLTLVTLLSLATAPAQAQEYDGTAAEGSVQPEGDIVVTASGFMPNTTITYTVDKDGVRISAGSAESNSDGNVTFTVAHQGDGEYVITMTDGENVQVLGVTVDLTADRPPTDAPGVRSADTAPTGGDALPRTGSDASLPLGQLGVALVMAGAVAVYIGKRGAHTRSAG